MKTHYSPLQRPNLKSFYEFAKLNNTQKASVLKNDGVLLDKDSANESSVNLYYLNGFFVEETISRTQNTNTVVDIIPYKHGYRLETYAEIKPTVVPKRPNPLF